MDLKFFFIYKQLLEKTVIKILPILKIIKSKDWPHLIQTLLHLEDAQGNAEEDNLFFKILVSHEFSVPHDDVYAGSNLQDLHQKSRQVPVLQGARGGKALNLRGQANLAIIK